MNFFELDSPQLEDEIWQKKNLIIR